MLVGLGREDLEERRARGDHRQRVPVVGTHLIDAVVLDDAHDLFGAADGARRQTAAEHLGERHHVRLHAELLGGAAGRDREARLDLVEDQHDPVARADVPHGLEVTGLGEHNAKVHHGGFHDHARGQATLGGQAINAALHRGRVVERHRDRHVDGGLRDARAVGERLVVLAVADLVVLHTDRHHHGVVVTVVRAEDLQHGVAAGEGTRDADRVHRRLGARVGEAPLGQAPASGKLVGNQHRVLRRHAKVRAEREALGDGVADGGVRVTLHHGAKAVVEVVVLVAVNVGDALARAGGDVDGPRVARLIRRGDAAAQVLRRVPVHLA